MTIEEAIVDTVRELLPNQQQEVLHFAKSLRRPSRDVLSSDRPADGNAVNDSLAPFLGAFETTTPDSVQRHDAYLADAYADPHEP